MMDGKVVWRRKTNETSDTPGESSFQKDGKNNVER